MLKFGTMSPVGNLRIKDSVPDWDSLASSKTFSVTDVMNRASDFLDYARERGAAAGRGYIIPLSGCRDLISEETVMAG
ncbi:hypothetical protein LNP17_21565 [Klebsiella variicola subsp. variicola]|nr:hypothetical protein [Klebsiella variicola subsp. variicola]